MTVEEMIILLNGIADKTMPLFVKVNVNPRDETICCPPISVTIQSALYDKISGAELNVAHFKGWGPYKHHEVREIVLINIEP